MDIKFVTKKIKYAKAITLLLLVVLLGCNRLEESSEDDDFNGFFHAIAFSGGLGDFAPMTNTESWMIEFNIGTDPITENQIFGGRAKLQETYHSTPGLTGADMDDPTMTCNGTVINLNANSVIFNSLKIGENLENESSLESGDPYFTFYVVLGNGVTSTSAHVCVFNAQTSTSTYTLVDSAKVR